MNDLPQNELLSAYLDGELSAAEQAEMERLLAASPDARQLLEELRALSTTLQSLPQEKLDEDLGPRVLRVAERRMLTGEEPDAAPTPLVRSAFRRLLNPRGLVWAGLAVAIAVMIWIHQWRQDAGPIARVDEDIVMAPGLMANNRIVPEGEKAPAVRVTRTRNGMSLKEAESRALEEYKATTPVTEDEPLSFGAAAKAPTEMPTDRRSEKAEALARDESSARAVPEMNASSLPMPAGSPHFTAKKDSVPTKGGSIAGKAGGTGSMAYKRKAGGVARYSVVDNLDDAEQAEKAGLADNRILVVRCDISPEAANQRALEKLLDANGMTWRERTDWGLRRNKAVNEKLGEDAKQTLDKERGGSNAAGDVNLVWTEATSAQIEATLAGLVAQPDVFFAFSVNPPQNELPKDVVEKFLADGKTLRGLVPGGGLFQFEQRAKVAGPTSGQGVVGRLEMDVRQLALPSSVEEKSQVAAEVQQQQIAPSAPRQRVLFVVRVVDKNRSSVAESETQAAPPAAKPAEPPNPPPKQE